MEWYKKTWVCIVFLIFIFPVGLFLLWNYHSNWKKSTKIILTIVMGIFFVGVVGNALFKEYPTELEIMSDTITIDINEEKEIELSVKPENVSYDVIDFISDDNKIVSFKSNEDNDNLKGEIIGLEEGTTTIYIQSKDIKSEKVTVIVEDRKRIEEEKKSANEVMEKISDIGQVTLDSEDIIQDARKSYDELSDESKSYVTNYDILVQAEEEYEELKEEEKQKQELNLNEGNNTDVGKNETQNIDNGNSVNNDNSEIVYWTPKGEKYHVSKGCRTLANSDTIYSGTVAEAQANGKSEKCKVCG